jgi:hypothetical protein
MITLGTQTLHPALVWDDEFTWSPNHWATDMSITGALIVYQCTRPSPNTGRPITLVGGENFCPITRQNLITLRDYVHTITNAGVVLTLHDGRTFTVIPAQSDVDCIECYPYPVVLDHGISNPTNSTMYYIAKISLTVV